MATAFIRDSGRPRPRPFWPGALCATHPALDPPSSFHAVTCVGADRHCHLFAILARGESAPGCPLRTGLSLPFKANTSVRPLSKRARMGASRCARLNSCGPLRWHLPSPSAGFWLEHRYNRPWPQAASATVRSALALG